MSLRPAGLLFAAGLAVAALALPALAQQPATARASLLGRAGAEIGTATFTDGPRGVLIAIDIKAGSLPPGAHGIHLHGVGTCADHGAGFTASGGHVGVPGLPHGLLNPAGNDHGDLPNLIVHADGSVAVELYTTFVSLAGAGGRPALLDANGSALVVHAQRDDHINQPIGNAGPRLACGVITRG